MHYDFLILGATPAGIASAVAAAREGLKVLLLERYAHIGGLPANGLGATDISRRDATTGFFRQFVERIAAHYRQTYGENSQQYKDCSNGYHFEASVAEAVLWSFLNEYPDLITVQTGMQFDVLPERVEKAGSQLLAVQVVERATGALHRFTATSYADCTYEGDLAAAAGIPYRLGREDVKDFHEPFAGCLYKAWALPPSEDSTGAGDECVQAYNYRLCLTRDPANRVPFRQPANYDRTEYLLLSECWKEQKFAGIPGRELYLDGIGFLTNIVILPNGKSDANNQHLAFISTDLPEENYPWPEADWQWRDRFAVRLREYIEGLFWFAATDPSLPEEFRSKVNEWGYAADEYQDNDNFPRYVYVREGRRIKGLFTLTAHDISPIYPGMRPPVYPTSVTASSYALDSHACHKAEPGKPALEGFFNFMSKPYTVPYEAMVAKEVDNVIVPVAVSATHIGFSSVRMEPAWMALGEAAGIAAAMLVNGKAGDFASLPVRPLQEKILTYGGTLIYQPGDHPKLEGFAERQLAALERGLYQPDPELATQ